MRFVTGWVLALAGTALLGACSSSSETPRQAPCPRITLLREGADLTVFREGAGQDLSVMEYDARLTGFDARCDYTNRRRDIAVEIVPRFEVERGPVGRGSSADLHWFVAVSDAQDTRVIDRAEYDTRAIFQTNVSRGALAGERVRLTVPNSDGRNAAEFNVRISFRLTPEQLAYNRRRGPR
ncbi:MAG TPA: hypothetical protein VGM87_10150 [Roseomonas sp.]